MVSAARVTGHWPDDLPIIEAAHLGYLPKEEVLAVVTGSQGEPRATLSRLAANNCFDLSLDADDLVIFSAMRIPGNEQAIDRLVAQFKGRKIRTLQAHETNLMIHVSGHPCREELKQLYAWVQPTNCHSCSWRAKTFGRQCRRWRDLAMFLNSLLVAMAICIN